MDSVATSSSYSVQVGLHRIGVSRHSSPHSQNCIIITRDYPGKDPALFLAEEVPHEVRVSFCHGSEKIDCSDLIQDTRNSLWMNVCLTIS